MTWSKFEIELKINDSINTWEHFQFLENLRFVIEFDENFEPNLGYETSLNF